MSKKAPRSSNTKDSRMRQQLAQEAARLIAEEGIRDYHAAKQKAALRLHAPHTHSLPRNDEIQFALEQYQRLFKQQSQPRHLQHLRESSRKIMACFRDFEPRLVGAVVDGTADEYSDICIHLFANSAKEINLFLIDQHLPYELGSQNITQANGETAEHPCFYLAFDDVEVQLIIFSRKELRTPPRSPIDGKPMQRLSISKVDELLTPSTN